MPRQKLIITDLYGVESAVATEYRRLLHNIRKRIDKAVIKSVMITSAVGGEGKSTISSLLAVTAARKGLKTVLMDCDFRKPTIHKIFGMNRGRGMTDVLSEGLPIKSAIKKTEQELLDVITAGKPTPHPSELFDTRAIASIVEELKFFYDFAFVDTPPVIPVSDPMLLAPEMDGTVLVVKAGETAREVVHRAAEIMNSNTTNLIGVVMNNAKQSLPYYFDYTRYRDSYDRADYENGNPGDANNANKRSTDNPPRTGGSGKSDKKRLTN